MRLRVRLCGIGLLYHTFGLLTKHRFHQPPAIRGHLRARMAPLDFGVQQLSVLATF